MAIWVVILLDEPPCIFEDKGFVFNHFIRWQTTLAFSDAHRAPRRMKANTHFLRGLNLMVEGYIIRINIKMIARSCATREHQLRHSQLGGRVYIFSS